MIFLDILLILIYDIALNRLRLPLPRVRLGGQDLISQVHHFAPQQTDLLSEGNYN